MTDGRDALDGAASVNAAAGALASASVLAALFPLDALKTHVQAGASAASALRAPPTRAAALARVYRGVVPAITEHALNRSVLFGLGTILKDRTPPEWPEPARDAFAGAGAALCKTLALHPARCRGVLAPSRPAPKLACCA